MLQFDLSGRIMGCTVQTYLLEKVRIVLPSYHPPPVRIVQQQRGELRYLVIPLALGGVT